MISFDQLVSHLPTSPTSTPSDVVAAAAGMALDCAMFDLPDPELLTVHPSWEDRRPVLARRLAGEGSLDPSPLWLTWHHAGRPGYQSCADVLDRVDTSVWTALDVAEESCVDKVVSDLSWSHRFAWSVAVDFGNFWAVGLV